MNERNDRPETEDDLPLSGEMNAEDPTITPEEARADGTFDDPDATITPAPAEAAAEGGDPLDVPDFNYKAYTAAYDDESLDVDAALAAVSSLSDVVAEEEAEAQAELDRQAADEETVAEPAYQLPMPGLVWLGRGQLPSIITGLLLIVLGAGLTALNTVPDLPEITPLVVLAALTVALVLVLLSYWLAAGRWSRGTFFFAVLLVLMAVAGFILTVPGGLSAEFTAPVLFVASGLAVVLTAWLTRPVERRMQLPGVLMVFGGLVLLALQIDVLPGDIVARIASYWYVVPVVLIVVWLLPLVFRRRRRE